MLQSETTRKKRKIDSAASTNEFHKKVIKTFLTASVAEISQAFNLSVLPILQALLMLDPKSYPETDSKEFQTYGNNSLRILYNYYGRDASNEFRGRFTKSNRLLKCPYDALQLEFGGFKTCVNKQKIKLKRKIGKGIHSLKVNWS